MKGEINMNGSLQIKNNKYHMVISYVDKHGRHKKSWKTTGLSISVKGNEKLARAMLTKRLEELQGCNLEKSNMLLSVYLNNWIQSVEMNLKPTTFNGYKANLKNHILPYFSMKKAKLSELRFVHLEEFYGYLIKEKSLSPTTVRHCHRLISCALNEALRTELIQVNPATLARLPRQEKYEAKFLNYSQIKTLVKLFDGSILQPLIKFMSVYGVRRSEALGLCWDMVDFENNCFTIARTVTQVNGTNVLSQSTKTQSSYRTMPLSETMKTLLMRLKEERDKYAVLFPEKYATNDFVFVWKDGSPITPNYVTRNFHKILDASDLPTIRLCDLRHSVASNLLSKGRSIVEAQHWLGHSQPSTTLNFYSHVNSSFKIDVIKQIETELTFELDD